MFHDCDDCKHHDRITDFDTMTCMFCDYEEGYEFGYGGPTGWAPKEDDTESKEVEMDRENYCKDCSRSIWGDKSCDVNVENNGRYVMADEKCYCKCNENGKVEKYPWEE